MDKIDGPSISGSYILNMDSIMYKKKKIINNF